MKKCRKCSEEKEVAEFEKGRMVCKACRKLDHKLTYETNKETRKTQVKKWVAENPEKYKAYAKTSKLNNKDKNRDRYLKRRFGISLETFLEMSAKQNHLCKICNSKELTYKNLNVDHCHETGKIRGLLCTSCNTALGLLKDSIENLQSAIRYLTNAM